jgi:hypothetical protein
MKNTVISIFNKFIEKLPTIDFSLNKLGGLGKVVQTDETKLNFKCKSHSGRLPSNKTDALCIVELGEHIQRIFACTIPNKLALTLIPIVCSQVESGCTIWTE